MSELIALAERVEAAHEPDNRLDVKVELAMFKPNTGYIAARANAAGTKVIFTDCAGAEWTHWAREWTRGDKRIHAAMRLRALAAIRDGEPGK